MPFFCMLEWLEYTKKVSGVRIFNKAIVRLTYKVSKSHIEKNMIYNTTTHKLVL